MREMLVRIDERLKLVIERLDSQQVAWGELRDQVEANTARSLANEIQGQRHEETLTWVSRTVLGVVVLAVLVAAGIGVGPL